VIPRAQNEPPTGFEPGFTLRANPTQNVPMQTDAQLGLTTTQPHSFRRFMSSSVRGRNELVRIQNPRLGVRLARLFYFEVDFEYEVRRNYGIDSTATEWQSTGVFTLSLCMLYGQFSRVFLC
jgi:hypothetical protein